jgi:hypothetical protein
MWALYGVLPRVFIPAGVGAFEALRHRASGTMRVGMLFAVLAALSMMLGLMRWPSVHWELARACAAAAEGDRVVLAAVFDGLNRVESAGKDVKRFKKGDAIVASTGMAGGGHARYVCLPEKGALALKSESLTWEEAVAIPFGANTALYFLRNLGKIEAGQRTVDRHNY